MPRWSRAGCARLVQCAAATIPDALKLLPAVSFPRSRRCSHRRRVPPPRQIQRPECWFIVGRFSGDYVWPVLGDYRGADSIFNYSAKAIEIEDIEARVSELERAA